QIQLAMARAIDLVINERMHHSFCVRAPKMISEYKEVWKLAWAERWQSQTEEQQIVLKTWYKSIELTEDTAIKDIERDYESAKRRSVILLSDLLESYIESILQLCIVHSMQSPKNIKSLTGREPKSITDPACVKKSVRHWEKHKFPNFASSRAARVMAMMQTFMPLKFEKTREIDEIFFHRNALTHEIVQIGELENDGHRSADAANLSLEQVDNYFNVVGDFVCASMDAFKSYQHPIVVLKTPLSNQFQLNPSPH
ncbi:MAG: hypothetical protein ABL918_12345, partial [Chakrabartia sp.]